jgi:hypothetical protein
MRWFAAQFSLEPSVKKKFDTCLSQFKLKFSIVIRKQAAGENCLKLKQELKC